jgi:hypothetical protein
MSEEAELASPAAAISGARRESRSTMPERLKVSRRCPRLTTAQTTTGIQKRGRALLTRRTAMPRTVVQMAARKRNKSRADPLCLYFSV